MAYLKLEKGRRTIYSVEENGEFFGLLFSIPKVNYVFAASTLLWRKSFLAAKNDDVDKPGMPCACQLDETPNVFSSLDHCDYEGSFDNNVDDPFQKKLLFPASFSDVSVLCSSGSHSGMSPRELSSLTTMVVSTVFMFDFMCTRPDRELDFLSEDTTTSFIGNYSSGIFFISKSFLC